MKPPPQCGSLPAAWRHMRRREPLDDACRETHNAYQREKKRAARSTPAGAARRLWLDRTLARAQTRLAAEYPERFAELLAEERAKPKVTVKEATDG